MSVNMTKYLKLLLGILIFSLLIYSVIYKIDKDNKHETAEAVLNRIVVVSNSEDIRMSYGQYSSGSGLISRYEDKPRLQNCYASNLRNHYQYFPNSKVEKLRLQRLHYYIVLL